MYYELGDWVTDHFLPIFRRTLGGEYRWCAQWWKHDEAVSRLKSLWHSWEVLRLQPGTGIGVWYRDHLDHQLPILMGARGPFYQCSETAHREPREAAAVPLPGERQDPGVAGEVRLLPRPAGWPGAGPEASHDARLSQIRPGWIPRTSWPSAPSCGSDAGVQAVRTADGVRVDYAGPAGGLGSRRRARPRSGTRRRWSAHGRVSPGRAGHRVERQPGWTPG